MSKGSKIEWCDDTWNPTVGCTIVSPGCTNCYAMKLAHGLERRFGSKKYGGLTKVVNSNPVWTGEVRLDEAALLQPFKWRQGRRIFVNSMSDLFHESLSDAAIDKVFAVMALGFRHTYQVLTKRADRMRRYMQDVYTPDRVREVLLGIVPQHADLYCDWMGANRAVQEQHGDRIFRRMNNLPDKITPARELLPWPLPNVWLGVSTERQEEADERIPLLLQTPAAVRFLSCEPLLGPIDLTAIEAPDKVEGERWTFNAMETGDYYTQRWETTLGEPRCSSGDGPYREHKLDWVIAGGESGPKARPMHPAWPRSLRDQCKGTGVAFFLKQMTKKAPIPDDLLIREWPNAA